jgi:hypothetical protein
MKKLAYLLLGISAAGQIISIPAFLLKWVSPEVIDFITNQLSWFALLYTAMLFVYEARNREHDKESEAG